jgi:hypothetical protein
VKGLDTIFPQERQALRQIDRGSLVRFALHIDVVLEKLREGRIALQD